MRFGRRRFRIHPTTLDRSNSSAELDALLYPSVLHRHRTILRAFGAITFSVAITILVLVL